MNDLPDGLERHEFNRGVTDDTPRDPLAAQPLSEAEIAAHRERFASLRGLDMPETLSERWLATLDRAIATRDAAIDEMNREAIARLDATRPSGDPICEHRLATPCRDRNGSCGTHLSPWATRPSGDEALRAALEANDRDHLLPFVEALATPASSPDVEGLIRESDGDRHVLTNGVVVYGTRRDAEVCAAALRDSRS